jgi:acetyltransferase-like isoleucine patch superfamily enzyme
MVLGISGPALGRITQRIGSKAFSLFIAKGFRNWGSESVAVRPFRVNGERWISVGSGVYFGAGCWLNATPAGNGSEPVLIIGDGCNFTGDCVISAALSVKIGDEVLVARNVYVADHDHAFLDVNRAVLRQGIGNEAAVIIGDGAWLGHNAVVTSGVRIGRGAVIGANAVVTADVPDYCLAVGVPARVVKSWGGAESEGAFQGSANSP